MAKLPPRAASLRVPTRDEMNAVPRGDVARAAFNGISYIEREHPHVQIHAAAVLMLALCERLGVDPRDTLERSERILASRHQLADTRGNEHLAALSDYIAHVNNPATNAGLRPQN